MLPLSVVPAMPTMATTRTFSAWYLGWPPPWLEGRHGRPRPPGSCRGLLAQARHIHALVHRVVHEGGADDHSITVAVELPSLEDAVLGDAGEAFPWPERAVPSDPERGSVGKGAPRCEEPERAAWVLYLREGLTLLEGRGLRRLHLDIVLVHGHVQARQGPREARQHQNHVADHVGARAMHAVAHHGRHHAAHVGGHAARLLRHRCLGETRSDCSLRNVGRVHISRSKERLRGRAMSHRSKGSRDKLPAMKIQSSLQIPYGRRWPGATRHPSGR